MADDPRRTAARTARRVGLALLLVWTVLPLLPLLVWSVAGEWRYPSLLPTAYSSRALRFVVSDASGVREGLVTSAVIAVSVAVVATVIGAAAGRALALHRFRGRGLVRFLLLSPVIVPPLASALGIQVVFVRLGLASTAVGVALVHLIPTIPYVTLVMESVYATYDTDYEAQARTLGASAFATFRTVTLPQLVPGLAVAGLFAFLVSWSEYLLTLVVGGGRVQTLPLLLFSFLQGNDDAVAAALALAFVAPAVALLALTSRFLGGGPPSAEVGRP